MVFFLKVIPMFLHFKCIKVATLHQNIYTNDEAIIFQINIPKSYRDGRWSQHQGESLFCKSEIVSILSVITCFKYFDL